jgi:hypothetical protein
VLQHELADRETHRFRRAALVGKIPGQFIVEPDPVDLVGQHDQRMLHVDDPIETGAEKVVMPRFLLLFRPHPTPRVIGSRGIMNGSKRVSQIPRKRPQIADFLQIQLQNISRDLRQTAEN